MKNVDSKGYRIYSKSLHQWVKVPKRYYEQYDKERTNFRKRKQYHGQCYNTRKKWWLCDMMCEDCEYRRAGNELSLDAPRGDGSITILDQQENKGPRMEEIIIDRIILDSLIKRFQELDSEADTILALWQEDPTRSDRAIAKKLKRPQRTFAGQMKRYRNDFRKISDY